jgi:hypothetical protein
MPVCETCHAASVQSFAVCSVEPRTQRRVVHELHAHPRRHGRFDRAQGGASEGDPVRVIGRETARQHRGLSGDALEGPLDAIARNGRVLSAAEEERRAVQIALLRSAAERRHRRHVAVTCSRGGGKAALRMAGRADMRGVDAAIERARRVVVLLEHPGDTRDHRRWRAARDVLAVGSDDDEGSRRRRSNPRRSFHRRTAQDREPPRRRNRAGRCGSASSTGA